MRIGLLQADYARTYVYIHAHFSTMDIVEHLYALLRVWNALAGVSADIIPTDSGTRDGCVERNEWRRADAREKARKSSGPAETLVQLRHPITQSQTQR